MPANAVLDCILSEYGGKLTVRQFMDVALHHPEHGYYRKAGKSPTGRQGDFTTAPLKSQLPAIAIVNWLQRLQKLGREYRHIIEIGPGDASLANAIYAELGWCGRRHYSYHLVESSAAMRQLQQESKYASKFHWHETINAAISSAPSAVIIHNELVDAFPCHVLEYYCGNWQEVTLLIAADGSVTEKLAEADLSVPQPWHYSALDWRPQEGQRVEVHAAYFDWLADWLPQTQQLDMLTIDYGGSFPELYHRRPHGTLRAYFHHMLMEGQDVYLRPSHQDITADANFTDLDKNGSLLGLHAARPLTLADFLREPCSGRELTATDYRLLEPQDAGGQFHVLHQWKPQTDATN